MKTPANEKLTAYLLHDLPENERREVEEAIQSSDRCRAHAESIESTLDRLRDALAASIDAPVALSRSRKLAVLDAIGSAPPPATSEEKRPSLKLIYASHPWLVRAAALVVVVGGLAIVLSRVESVFTMHENVDFDSGVDMFDVETLSSDDDVDGVLEGDAVLSTVFMEGRGSTRGRRNKRPTISTAPAKPLGGVAAGNRDSTIDYDVADSEISDWTDSDKLRSKSQSGKAGASGLGYLNLQTVDGQAPAPPTDETVDRYAVNGAVPSWDDSNWGLYSRNAGAFTTTSGDTASLDSPNEKPPILGSIPIAGSLFRQQSEWSGAGGSGPKTRSEPKDDSRRRALDKLEKIVIPELDFHDANLEDALTFIQESIREYDGDESEPAPRIETHLETPETGKPVGKGAGAEDPFAATFAPDPEPDSGNRRVTFKARHINAREALNIVSDLANVKYVERDGKIDVVPADAPTSDIITQTYSLPAGIQSTINSRMSGPQSGEAKTNRGAEDSGDHLKQFFSQMGTAWPRGSRVTYLPEIGKLVVANTLENQEKIGETLEGIQDQKKEKKEAELREQTRFKAYGVNPFVDCTANPFSTFAIDVDTASYTMARRYLNEGLLPPAESVRTEEFVNFFDYHDAAPSHRTFRVYAEAAPSRFGRGLHMLKVAIKGRRLGREEQRRAVLTFLVDTSGSMDKPERIGLIHQSLRMLVEKLNPDDRVAIVQYSSHARIVLPHTRAAEKKKILAALDSMQCGGATNLEEGMRRAYEMAAGAFVPGGENRVLLLSDGVANLGSGESDHILRNVEQFRRQGVTCSVFGFGAGSYDDVMLETLANRGDGQYAYIDGVEEATRIFVDDLSATLNTIAADVKIQVEFDSRRVRRYRQLGYENRQLTKEQFRDDSVDAGEVGSGQSVTALYELELQGSPRDPIGIVRVRYRRLDTGAVEETEHAVTVADLAPQFNQASEGFRLAACVAEFAELLRGSPHAAGGSYQDIATVLAPVALERGLDPYTQELLRLVQGAPGMSRGEFQ